MRRKTAPLRSWVTPEEKQEVVALAKQAHLTTSELVRRLVTGRQLPETKRHEEVLMLLEVNADLARLGNLLRMAVMEEDFEPPQGVDLEKLFEDLRGTQEILKRKIEAL